MKRECLKLAGLIGILVLGLAPSVHTETVQPIIVVFYEEGCPSCELMDAALEELLNEFPSLTVARHDLMQPGSSELLDRLADAYNLSSITVPVIFVGDAVIVGADRIQEMHLRSEVEKCILRQCPSPLSRVVGNTIPWKDLGTVALLGALFLFLLWFQDR